MADELSEAKFFATFEKHGEFANAQQSFLVLDLNQVPSPEEEKREAVLFQKLSNILDEYQEQSYLLDPFLEGLIAPVVEHLKTHAKNSIADPARQCSPRRVERVALLLYSYVKLRGYKTIIRFFPHEVADLSIALDYMLIPEGLPQDTSQWALRYIVLIWLSLICMIPFDLAQFDEVDQPGATATAIETLAKSYLGKAGLERDGAALLLSRFYMRKDTFSRFYTFLDWSNDLLEGHFDVFTAIGLLQVLCEFVKSGPADEIQARVPQFLAVANVIDGLTTLSSNTVVRKFKTKLVARIALRVLPAKSSIERRKGRALTGMNVMAVPPMHQDDIEVPENVEIILEQLFGTLQDKDSIVRWSAAKGVARISERLPTDFADQVLETIVGLFAIHSIAGASLYDLPAIAESTWHGACLACAEMARRGLVMSDKLPELIDWLSKALYFDLRKGAHSIGSNVRDAAAYVLWALARTQDPQALVPHANNLARRLVTVALYDREIHIRRAASAAFQEYVGRTSLFPHGIDVLRKTDFYAVSVRRNAFLTAAPQVAEHSDYKLFLFDHILDVVLRHWDITMRQLGSQSLRLICSPDLLNMGPQAAANSARLLDSVDLADVHGALLALTELALAYREAEPEDLETRLREVFKYLSLVSQDVLFGPRNELVTASACRLLAASVTLVEINMDQNSSVPHWRKLVDFGLKHRSVPTQEAAAEAVATISGLVDCSSVVTRLIQELKAGSPIVQQSLGRVLGVVDYATYPNCLVEALDCLLECVKPSSVIKSNVEARRNCYLAMPQILATIVTRLSDLVSPKALNSLYNALQAGLQDYTVDERGDVGSWIRIACIQGLTSFSEILLSNAASIPNFDAYFPSLQYQNAVGGILKQGVERLDNVRHEAGECLVQLLRLSPPSVSNSDQWRLPGFSLLYKLFESETDSIGWNDGDWLFPKAVHLLEVQEYRKFILPGLVLSMGSKTDSTQRPVAASLIAYVYSLPVTPGEGHDYDLAGFAEDLLGHARSHLASNIVVIPVLQTFNVLLEADAFRRLSEYPNGLDSLRALFSIASKNVARLKSIQRIHESMKIVVNLLSFETFFDGCIATLPGFLGHNFPSIRADTAEYLYLVLQSTELDRETDEVEDVLLETEWASGDLGTVHEAAERVVQLFSNPP